MSFANRRIWTESKVAFSQVTRKQFWNLMHQVGQKKPPQNKNQWIQYNPRKAGRKGKKGRKNELLICLKSWRGTEGNRQKNTYCMIQCVQSSRQTPLSYGDRNHSRLLGSAWGTDGEAHTETVWSGRGVLYPHWRGDYTSICISQNL